MATVKEGINGPFKGKVGSVIGSSWRKIHYVKGFSRFKKKRSPSPEQALQRKKFAMLNRFLEPISGYLEIGFRTFTGRATGRNVAFSYNYDHAFHVDGDNVQLNYPELQFSHGSLFTAGDEKAWKKGDTVHVSWNPNTYGLGGAMDDAAHLILYEEVNRIFRHTKAIRYDGTGQITNPVLKQDPIKLHLWLLFVDKLGKQV